MLALFACNKPEQEVEPVLEVSTDKITVNAYGGDRVISITSNNAWVIDTEAEWISFTPESGDASDQKQEVKVYIDENTVEEPRNAKITVTSGALSADIDVTQEAAEAVEPEPGPDAETYLLVGDAVGGWNFDNPVVLTLAEGYYVAKEVEVAGEKDMHFTKNSSWEGNVKGLHGRIAPNEIGEVGGNNISLTVGGSYDIYLTEALDKFYFMTPGKTPAEAVEHVEIATVWGVCGAIEGNSWGGASDPVLSQEGEWFVAKGITFTEVNFKVRGNNTWADDTKWGCAAKDQACELNKAIAVSTCTEFIAANEGEGDNPNVFIDAPAGAYDIYFSPEKKEVWVMTPGYKPGEAPAPADVDIDGKQWTFVWQAMGGASCVIDLGVTEPGTAILAYDMGIVDPASAGIYSPYMVGTYTVAKTDGTSGVVTLSADGQSVEIPYSNATENSVHFAAAALLQEDVDCTLATSLIEISLGTGPEPEPEDPDELTGDGTEANPYVLKTAEHMVAMRTLAVLDGTTYFRMANDIDMASVTNWVPVNYDQGYTRQIHFDGNNYTISNFAPQTYTNVQDDGTEVTAGYHSLFGIMYGSCKNVKINNVTIEATNGCGVIGGYVGTTGLPGHVENVTITNASITNKGDRAGGVCGNAKEATFKNVSFQGTVTSTYTEKEAKSGGFVGHTETSAVFENCSVDVVLTGDSQDLGGFVGKATGNVSFTGCDVKVELTSNVSQKNRCGGFIGWNSTVTADFTDCHVLAGSTITNTTERASVTNGNFGGFAGFGDTANTVATFTDCSADVVINVDDKSTYNGGFIGGTGYASTLTLKGCSAAGVVNGNNYVGGFFGASQGTTIIEQCSSSVDVTSSGMRSGSFVGVATAAITIRDCYSTGDVVAVNQQVGGILGYTGKVASVIERCYSTSDITSNTAGTGGILGTNQIAGTEVVSCIAWNTNIICNRSASDKWAPGAVVGASDKTITLADCYRRADMNFVDAAGAMTLFDQENVTDGQPTAPSYSDEGTQRAYHGKAAAADATASSVAKALGWPEDVWDLSGDLPKLK